MKKSGLTILAFTFIIVQLLNCGLNYYMPVIHAICYNHFLSGIDNKHEEELVIVMDLATYRRALNDEYEILWNGEYFDVERTAIKGNEITVIVEKDISENNWVNTFSSIQQKLNKEKQPYAPDNNSFNKWLLKLYIPEPANNIIAAGALAVIENSLYRNSSLPVYYPKGVYEPPDGMI